MSANVAAVVNVAIFAVISLVALVNDAAVAVVKVDAAALIDVAVVNNAADKMLLQLLLSVMCLSMMLQLQFSMLLLCCELCYIYQFATFAVVNYTAVTNVV